jgi:hypothetical protein
MTDFYTLFQELEGYEVFQQNEEYQTLRAQLEKLGRFEQRQRKFKKDNYKVYRLKKFNNTTIIVGEGEDQIIQNRLEYEIQAGRVNPKDPLLKYI